MIERTTCILGYHFIIDIEKIIPCEAAIFVVTMTVIKYVRIIRGDVTILAMIKTMWALHFKPFIYVRLPKASLLK